MSVGVQNWEDIATIDNIGGYRSFVIMYIIDVARYSTHRFLGGDSKRDATKAGIGIEVGLVPGSTPVVVGVL